MRRTHQKLLTGVMLAIYGGVALLGYGLHSLSPHGGHHHGVHVVTCATHSSHATCDCAFHRRLAKAAAAQSATTGNEWVVTDGGCTACCHECGICTLLVQMGNSRAQMAPQIVWQHVVSVAAAADAHLYWIASLLGPQAPRGPPADVA